MKKLLMAAVGAIALMGVASAANAATTLSFTTNFSGNITVQPGPNIGAINTSLTLPATITVGSISPSDTANATTAGVVSGGAVGLSPASHVIALALGVLSQNIIVTVGNLTYTFTFGNSLFQHATGASNDPGTINYAMSGTITGDTSSGTPFLNQTASMSFACTQSILGSSIGCGTSVDTPSSVQTPEPASLALLGAGLVGLGFARRRRG